MNKVAMFGVIPSYLLRSAGEPEIAVQEGTQDAEIARQEVQATVEGTTSSPEAPAEGVTDPKTEVKDEKPSVQTVEVKHPKKEDMPKWVAKHKSDDALAVAITGQADDLFKALDHAEFNLGSHLAGHAADYFMIHAGKNNREELFKECNAFVRKNVYAALKGANDDVKQSELKRATVEQMLKLYNMAGWLIANGHACIAYAPKRARMGEVVSLTRTGKYSVPRVCAPFNQLMPQIKSIPVTGKKTPIWNVNMDSSLSPIQESYIRYQFKHLAMGEPLQPDGVVKVERAPHSNADDKDKPKIDVENPLLVVEATGSALKKLAATNQRVPSEVMADTLDGVRFYLEGLPLSALGDAGREAFASLSVIVDTINSKLADEEAYQAAYEAEKAA